MSFKPFQISLFPLTFYGNVPLSLAGNEMLYAVFSNLRVNPFHPPSATSFPLPLAHNPVTFSDLRFLCKPTLLSTKSAEKNLYFTTLSSATLAINLPSSLCYQFILFSLSVKMTNGESKREATRITSATNYLSSEEDEPVQLPALNDEALRNRFKLTLIGRLFHTGGRSIEAFLAFMPSAGIWDLEAEFEAMTSETAGFTSTLIPKTTCKRCCANDPATLISGLSLLNDGSYISRSPS